MEIETVEGALEIEVVCECGRWTRLANRVELEP
jgi:hypothetical protein